MGIMKSALREPSHAQGYNTNYTRRLKQRREKGPKAEKIQ